MKIWLWLLAFGWTVQVSGQQVTPMKFSELREVMSSSSADVTVINFWATWCAPCVAELPHFEDINKKEGVDVYLVSLDFAADKEKVDSFVTAKNLASRVIWLDERDPDDYMPHVSKDWNGAIPATLVVDSWGKTHFYQQQFSKDELYATINKYLN